MKLLFLCCLILSLQYSLAAEQCLARGQPRSLPYKMTICTMIKNEALYIQEWIEYHLLLKVDHFYIYNDGSTDNIQEVLRPYIDEGIVTLLYWQNNKTVDETYVWKDPPYTRNQRFCIADCLYNRNTRDTTEWVGVWDVDEFPYMSNPEYQDFPELIDNYIKPQRWDNLQMPLTIVGSSDYKETPSGLVMENYHWRSSDNMFGYNSKRNRFMGKTMYRAECGAADVHYSNKLRPGCKHMSWWPNMATAVSFPVHVKHFHSKSYAEYAYKMKKWNWNVSEKDFEAMERNLHEVYDTDLLRFVDDVKQAIECRK